MLSKFNNNEITFSSTTQDVLIVDFNNRQSKSTDVRRGTLEYILDEHIEKCSMNIVLGSYPSCEVVSVWYRLLPVS